MEILLLQSVPTLRQNGEILSVKSKKAEALLLYMFLAGDDIYRREYLASLFWDDRSLKMARDNLRQACSRIKRFCPEIDAVLKVERDDIIVDRGHLQIDTDDFLKRLADKETGLDASCAKVNFADMFSGCDDVSAPFQSWIYVYRNEFERRAADALNAILASTEWDSDSKKIAADLLLKLDGTNEEAVRHKMRNFAERGMLSEALNQYNELYKLLDETYDVEPSVETIDLNAKIKLGEFEKAPAQVLPITPLQPDRSSPPCVYVAGFDIEQDDGFTQRMGNFFRIEVLGNLSKFREWNVVETDPKTDYYYKLDCQIAGDDENIAVIVTLRGVPEQRIVWSERFVTGFSNWQDTQWKIARNLALAINQSVTTDRIRTSLRLRPEDRGVFDKWAMCHNQNLNWTPSAANQVIATLTEIVDRTPDFNLAHAYLAEMHNKMHLVFPGLYRSQSSIDKAVAHAKTALNLDPLDPHAYRVLAWAKTLNGEFDLAEFHFSQACDLNPSNLYVTTSCALGFAFLDNTERACRLADEICEQPNLLQGFQWGYIQNIYYLSGRYDDALKAGTLAGDAISNLPAWQAAILKHMGETDQAKTSLKAFFTSTREKWHGKEDPCTTNILDWLFHCFPLRNQQKLEQLRSSVMAV